MGMKLAITGHREFPNHDWVEDQIFMVFKYGIGEDYKIVPTEVIQGMAHGVDQMAATVAINPTVDIPVISCRPWAGHTAGEELFYADILEESHEVVIVNESIEYPGPWVYQRRNEYMVDRGDMVLAVWDGGNKGGTYNCVRYAQKQPNKDIYWINPVEKEITWLRA